MTCTTGPRACVVERDLHRELGAVAAQADASPLLPIGCGSGYRPEVGGRMARTSSSAAGTRSSIERPISSRPDQPNNASAAALASMIFPDPSVPTIAAGAPYTSER